MQTPTYKQSGCQLRRRNYKTFITKQLKLYGYSRGNSNYEKSVTLSDVRAGSLVAQAPPNQLVSRDIRESIISVNRSDQNATTERSLESYPLNRLPPQRKMPDSARPPSLPANRGSPVECG